MTRQMGAACMTDDVESDELFFDSQDISPLVAHSEEEDAWHDAWDSWHLDDDIQHAESRAGGAYNASDVLS